MKIGFVTMVLTSAAAIALTGCSEDAPTENPTVEEAATQAEKLDRPEPGQYRQTIEITEMEMPGAPENLVAQIRSAVEQNAGRTYCLTPEQADEGFADQFRRVTENDDCQWNRFAVDNGKVDATLTCSGGEAGDVTIAMNGEVSSTASRIDMQMEQSNGAMNMNMAMTMQSERVGDCPA